MTRDFNALELDVEPGDAVTVVEEVAGFGLVTTSDGRTGWVPVSHLHAAEAGRREASDED